MTQALHHASGRQVSPNFWEPDRPIRDTSPIDRWRREHACRKEVGHCWHPEGLIDWWCCLCAAEMDGMPSQACRYCLADHGESNPTP